MDSTNSPERQKEVCFVKKILALLLALTILLAVGAGAMAADSSLTGTLSILSW